MDNSRGVTSSITVNVEGDFDPAVLRRAIAHLEKAISLDPGNARYRRVLAEAYLAARRFDAALTELLRIAESRTEPRLQYLVAYCHYRLGDQDAADSVLAAISGESSLGFSRLHLLRGRILFERHRHAEAMNEFSRALDLHPDAALPRWHMARALVAHAQSSLGDSTNHYRRALRLLANYAPTREQFDDWHYLLGRVHLALHHPVEALEHLERARRHAASQEKSLLLGFCYLLHGDRERARDLLASAATDPELRVRCTDYLCEVVSTPRDQLLAMGLPKEQAAVVGMVGEDFLAGIFGPRAPETARIIDVACSPNRQQVARTLVEETTDPLLGGRLFASATVDSGDVESTVVSKGSRRRSDPITAGDPSGPPDPEADTVVREGSIFPQTQLDVTEGMPMTGPLSMVGNEGPDPDEATIRSRDELADDDWDIGFDEFMSREDEPRSRSARRGVEKTQSLELPDDPEGEDIR